MAEKKSASKKRLDALLLERGLTASRQKAQAMILAGEVRVDGRPATKAGLRVALDANVEILSGRARFVSRAGEKLEGALGDFGLEVAGRTCLDAGCSTGGFTDCLLQRGAQLVYALDVSAAQLDWRLRRDDRVVIIEKNARHLVPSDVPHPPTLITVDLSFISVVKVLPALVGVAAPDAEWLILVKPQFELERKSVGRGGIVRDPRLHRRAVARVAEAAKALGLSVVATAPSRLTGARGNQEFFLYARRP